MTTDSINAEAMAQHALDAWGLSSARRELLEKSENIVFRVDTEKGETLVLRLHRPGYHTIEELISERQWTQALRQSGISTPVPVHATDGREYVLIEDDSGCEARYAGISRWVDGDLLSSVIAAGADPIPHTRRLGEMAARIHNQAADWLPPKGFTRQYLNADGLMGQSPFWGAFWASPDLSTEEQTRFSDLRVVLYDRLSHLGTEPDAYSMIHADLHTLNLVVDGHHLHVIDFDDAGFGWHMYELAVGLFYSMDHPRFPEMTRALFEGYRSIRRLDEASADQLPLFLLVRALAQIGWFADRPEQRNSAWVRWLVQKALALSRGLGM